MFKTSSNDKSVLFPIEIREARGVRTLHFGSDWVQGAMRLSRPWDLELAYTREMMAALLLSSRWPVLPVSILQIGLGAGSLTRFIHRHLPEARQTVVELLPAVVNAAQQMFQLPPESARLKVDIGEGARWLRDASKHFDLILVDGYDADAKAGSLESSAFYQSCRAHLNPRGLLVTNLLSRSPRILETGLILNAAFDGRVCFLPQTPGGNMIALAAEADTQRLDENELRDRAATLAASCNLDLQSLVDRIVTAAGPTSFGITS
jgi:spermidine synthase